MNDGGPAFPHEADYVRGDKPNEYRFVVDFHPGMTLRDYFAAAAIPPLAKSLTHWKRYQECHSPDVLSGELADIGEWNLNQLDGEEVYAVAQKAYAIADAMLDVRKEETP